MKVIDNIITAIIILLVYFRDIWDSGFDSTISLCQSTATSKIVDRCWSELRKRRYCSSSAGLTLYRMVMPIGTPFLKEKINN